MNVPNLYTNELSEDQINKPNIKEVFHKLVMQHESYSNFRIEDNILAFAQKVKSQEKIYTILQEQVLNIRLLT
jgi:Zn-finger domain-containing protein